MRTAASARKTKAAAGIMAAVLMLVWFGSCRKSDVKGLSLVGDGTRAKRGAEGLVVVTHGWIEQGAGNWPEDMALAIYSRTEPNQWLCGYFDWSQGAKTVNPTDAAKYARDIAGPKLAAQILAAGAGWRHIHLLGHSCGCWAISEAAKILTRKTKADIHLTFFDAYVPAFWKQDELASVNPPADVNCWAEQYYTRDITLGWTQQDLSFAHNVDLTGIDSPLKDHNFPWQWYLATVTGEYRKENPLHNGRPATVAEGVEYGFARGRECGNGETWQKSLKLPVGNKAVKLRKTR